jgi:hypothetical protein
MCPENLAEQFTAPNPVVLHDDSGWDDVSPVFVLAGYLASEGKWKEFSDDSADCARFVEENLSSASADHKLNYFSQSR